MSGGYNEFRVDLRCATLFCRFHILPAQRKGIALEEIARIVPTVFRHEIRRADAQLAGILAPLWPRIVGKAMAQHSRPARFERGTLTLAACPSWAAQLRQMAEEIRAEINSFLGRPVVRKLRVDHTPSWESAPAPISPGPLPLDVEALRESDSSAGASLGPEVSGIVERSFAKYFARSKRNES